MMEHVLKVKIYYEDTDCGGVVYYANYLRYFERARTGFLESKGLDLRSLMEEGVYFVVAEVAVRYRAPGRYGDILSVGTTIDKTGPASITFVHTVVNEAGRDLAEATVKLGCVDRDSKPMRLPRNIREAVAVDDH